MGGKLERFMNDFLRAFRSLRAQIFRFCSRYRNGGNPPFFEDSSPSKRLEPLNHTEMRAFLWAFGKTTSCMLLLYHRKHYSMRVLFWAPFACSQSSCDVRKARIYPGFLLFGVHVCSGQIGPSRGQLGAFSGACWGPDFSLHPPCASAHRGSRSTTASSPPVRPNRHCGCRWS